ncbi:hypothetical protein ACFY00_36825 [Kitasatospora sp. NPDC001540]|uniref:hypothetical protein n=1 Tax=Kitasatospora sp. NPDC001540 TaxID=3364014 RepID=UPI0036A075EE
MSHKHKHTPHEKALGTTTTPHQPATPAPIPQQLPPSAPAPTPEPAASDQLAGQIARGAATGAARSLMDWIIKQLTEHLG